MIQWSKILAMQIQLLVGELISHEPWHGKKKKKKVGSEEATGAIEAGGTSGSDRSKLELSCSTSS